MSALDCVCGTPAGINAGVASCTIEMGAMAFPVFEYKYSADGVTRNGIDVTSATVGSDITTKILASTAVTSRLFPTVRVQNPTVSRTDTNYETTANGDKFKLDGEGGVYSFLFEYFGQDGVFQILREFKKMGCTDVVMYIATTDGNLWGTKDTVTGDTLYGYDLSKETIDAYYQFAVPGAKARTMVSFDIDRDVCFENSYVITSAEMIATGGVKSTAFSPLVTGNQTLTNPSTTTFQDVLFEGFGTANNRNDITGLLVGAFTATDITAGLPGTPLTVSTAVESPNGTYLLTLSAPVAPADIIQFEVTASGYDVITSSFTVV